MTTLDLLHSTTWTSLVWSKRDYFFFIIINYFNYLFILFLDPRSKLFVENLEQREYAQKLDRKRHLLITKLQHLRKCANILVIGPDHAGKRLNNSF